MAAKTFEEWIHDGLENEHVPTDSHGWLRRAWEAATNAAEERFTSHNSTMPKLPGVNIVETHVLNIHHDCSINERSRIAGIVGEAYDYIAGQLRQ